MHESHCLLSGHDVSVVYSGTYVHVQSTKLAINHFHPSSNGKKSSEHKSIVSCVVQQNHMLDVFLKVAKLS